MKHAGLGGGQHAPTPPTSSSVATFATPGAAGCANSPSDDVANAEQLTLKVAGIYAERTPLTFIPHIALRADVSPQVLESYARLWLEYGRREKDPTLNDIGEALGSSRKTAQRTVHRLAAANLLELQHRPGYTSTYRLIVSSRYVQLPTVLVMSRPGAPVLRVFATLRCCMPNVDARRNLRGGCRVSWARICRLTGLGRSTVGRALRWLRKHGWLNRKVAWRHGRRLVCRWSLRLLRPAAPPLRGSGHSRDGGQVTSGTASDTPKTRKEEQGAHILRRWVEGTRAGLKGAARRSDRRSAGPDTPRVAGQTAGSAPATTRTLGTALEKLIGIDPDDHAPPGRLVNG